jgi:hypothetical protein
LANVAEADQKSDRKGNPVIYIALALSGLLALSVIGRTLAASYPRALGQPTNIEAPGIQSNPASLIKPQSVKYIG